MLLDMEDAGLSRSLLLFRTREVDHKIMLERIVRPNMTIYDIGGNIGYPGGFLPIQFLTGLFPQGLPAIATAAVMGILVNAIFLVFKPPKAAF